nr:VWA domain-containing protein [Opitutaceae bacterium]
MSYLFARGGRFNKLNWMLVVTLWALAALGELRLQPPEMGSDGQVRIRLDGLLSGQAARIEQLPGLGNSQAPSVVVQGRVDQTEFTLPPGGPIESYYRAVADAVQAVAVPQLRVPEALMTIPAGQVLRLAPAAFLTTPRPTALSAAVLTVSPALSGVAGDQLRLSTQGVVETRGGKNLYLEGRSIGTVQQQGSRLAIVFTPLVSADAIEAVARQVEWLPSSAPLESGYRMLQWEFVVGPGAPSRSQMQTVHVTQDCGQPTDIVVVLDRSPKLLQTEMNQAKAAVSQFIQNYPLQKGVQQIGLVSFCGAGFIHEPLSADRDRLLLSLSRIDRGARLDKIGCEETFVGSGMERALRLLTNVSTRKLMILLTPGQEVALNGDVAQRSADSEFLAARARALGVRVLAYGLGKNSDSAHLRRLVADADSFYPVPNIADLQPALLLLAGSTCTPELPFPSVDPGSDALVWLPNPLELSGRCEGCTPLAVGGWVADVGPGPVSLEGWGMNPVARFQSPGRYALQLHVTDRGFHASQTLHVTVLQSNLPPVLQATVYPIAPRQVLLAGEVSDDGVGSDGFLSATPVRVQWSQISGPAQARLDTASSLRTFADLPAAGSYQFELEGVDAGGLSMRRRVEVIATDDTKPQVFAGVGYVSAAVGGLRDIGNGTLHLQDVRGPVLKAFLVWHGPVDSLNPDANAFVTLDGHWIQGRSVGMSHDDQWLYEGDHPYLSGQAYQADVTPWVQKDGDYQLDHGLK